jgi:RND family efflux transporter MFP subunit
MMKLKDFSRSSVILLGLSLLFACGGNDTPAETLRPVRYTQVFSTGGGRARAFSGVARARVESRMSFRVSGSIQRVPVEVGDQVRVGQLLADLDPEDYRLQLEQAEAALSRARAEARNAAANFDRVRQLYESNNASPNQLDQARAGSESADAQVRSAENRRDAARLQLSYTRLTAPSAGQVAEVDVEVNENVTAGQPVVLLTSASELEVEVAVPEVLISRVREGSDVTVTFDALPGSSIFARVTEVGVVAGGLATTFPVAVRLGRPVEGLRSGMTAEVTFQFESTDSRDRILVPASAVGEDRDGRFVFVLHRLEEGIGMALRRPVTVGELTGDGFEVLDGLFDEELVITAGVSRIRDSLRVRIPGIAQAGS